MMLATETSLQRQQGRGLKVRVELTQAVLPVHIHSVRELNQSVEGSAVWRSNVSGLLHPAQASRLHVGQASNQVDGESVISDVSDKAR